MRSFIVGHASVGLALLIGNLAAGTAGRATPDALVGLAGPLLLAPTTAAYLTAMMLHAFRPRRILDVRCRRRPAAFTAGILSATVGWTIATGMIIGLDGILADTSIAASASCFAAWLVLRFASPIRPGHCLPCDYDLRASLAFGRCPECGVKIA